MSVANGFNRAYLSKKERMRLEVCYNNALKIIDSLKPVYLAETLELYVAPKGLLLPNGEAFIGDALEGIESVYCTVGSQNLVMNHIKNKCLRQLSELDPGSDFVPLKNGVVKISTGELQAYEKGMTFAQQYPIVYNPDASCPNFFKFLEEIQPDALARLGILRAFARCFDRSPSKMQAEIFVGEHDTGKSTLLRVLAYMLGRKNVASETLGALTSSEDRWAVGNLFGKSANVCGEMQSVELVEFERFKVLTGGDPISAEFKGKPKFEFQPHAKFFFACNTLPKINRPELKDDLAFFQRVNITYFERQFAPEEMDESLVMESLPEKSKLLNQREISGLFNVCLGILRQMREKKTCYYNFNGKEMRAQWFHELHHKVDDFLGLYTVKKEDGSVFVSEFKDRLNSWLRDKRHESILSDREINVRMQEKFGPQQHYGKRRWKGLVWRDEANETLPPSFESGTDGSDGQKPTIPPIIVPTLPIRVVKSDQVQPKVEKNPSDPSVMSNRNTDFDKNPMMLAVETLEKPQNAQNVLAEAIKKPRRPKIPNQISGNCQNSFHKDCGGVGCNCECHNERKDLEGGRLEKKSGEVLRRCKRHPEELLDKEGWSKHISQFHNI